MFDLHYDLLTNIYINKSNIGYMKRYIRKIYNSNNVCGGIFNLFYMSKFEMKDELGIPKDEIDIVKNLDTVINLIKKFHLIPNNIEYIFGIEGLDYLKSINDVDKLYDRGVRSVNIVWSNDNKFGGGVRGDKNRGLTKEGEKLVEKLVEKNIAIDLSHANEKTFEQIVTKCKKLKNDGKDPIVFASHSNVKNICKVDRNLSDSQIQMIRELGGVIGIVGIKDFLSNGKIEKREDYLKLYVDNINYVKNLLGSIDNICVSTDDMGYYKVDRKKYANMSIFKYNIAKRSIVRLLKNNGYNKCDINKILHNNFREKILNRLNI